MAKGTWTSWRWWTGFERTRTVAPDPVAQPDLLEPDDARARLADMVAAQIGVEQSLTANRMTWNLTFQGFTIAGFALVATASDSNPARYILQAAIAIVSFVIAIATLRGIVASQNQRSYLKAFWTANDLSRHFPRPFSETAGSKAGRVPATLMCVVLMAMWIVLLGLSLCWPEHPQQAIKFDPAGLIVRQR